MIRQRNTKKFFSEIKSEIKTLNGRKKLFYEKNYARIRVNTDDDSPLKQTIKISNIDNTYQMRFSRGCKIVSTNLFRWVLVWIIKVLQYDRIDISQGIDVNKTNASKE